MKDKYPCLYLDIADSRLTRQADEILCITTFHFVIAQGRCCEFNYSQLAIQPRSIQYIFTNDLGDKAAQHVRGFTCLKNSL